MQFLTLNDIKIVVDEDTFDVISQSSEDTINRAEKASIEEVSGYLRARYDVSKIFVAPPPTPPTPSDETNSDEENEILSEELEFTPGSSEEVTDNRNPQILLVVTDVMLYHLISWLPKRLGYEIRETRYLKWLDWLQDVQSGKITPNLPQYEDQEGNPNTDHYRIQYGGLTHQDNIY